MGGFVASPVPWFAFESTGRVLQRDKDSDLDNGLAVVTPHYSVDLNCYGYLIRETVRTTHHDQDRRTTDRVTATIQTRMWLPSLVPIYTSSLRSFPLQRNFSQPLQHGIPWSVQLVLSPKPARGILYQHPNGVSR